MCVCAAVILFHSSFRGLALTGRLAVSGRCAAISQQRRHLHHFRPCRTAPLERVVQLRTARWDRRRFSLAIGKKVVDAAVLGSQLLISHTTSWD